jgi:preprotein translocase subunit SecA
VTLQLAQPGSLWGAYPERRNDSNRRQVWSLLGDCLKPLSLSNLTRAAARRRAEAIYDQLKEYQYDPNLNRNLPTLRAQLRGKQLTATAIDLSLLHVALVAKGILNWSAFCSQLECAILLIEQTFVELATGEGKSLAMALAASVLALAGTPVHALTANEYLAKRDAELFEPLYRALELNVASAGEQDTAELQRAAFLADITYTTARCVGFAYLKDSLTGPSSPRLLRGLCCALIDEADVTLLDEAVMPLVLSQQVNDANERLMAFRAIETALQMREQQDWVGAKKDRALTPSARINLEKNPLHPWLTNAHRTQQILTALHAIHDLALGRDYLIRNNEIQIIDLYSGRVAQGRQWGGGLHAMVAVKEGIPTPKRTAQLASIQYPKLLQRYHHLAGLSGTLLDDKNEIEKIYQCPVVLVKPHHVSQRKGLTPVVTDTLIQACEHLVKHVAALNGVGRPVLIATQDVNQTEFVAQALGRAGLSATALSANNEVQEAQVIARAGSTAAITIATQMAGRGTDIKLDPAALQSGGLAIISFQLNTSPRTDRQVMGRSGRQGQPGSVQQWIVKEDLLLLAQRLGVSGIKSLNQQTSKHFWLAIHVKIQAFSSSQDRFHRARSIQADQQWAKRRQFLQHS